MTFGVTPTGFNRKRYEDILSDVAARQRLNISAQLLADSEDSIAGNLNAPICDEIASLWETLEAVWNSGDPNQAVGPALDGLAALVNLLRPTNVKSTVFVTLNTDAGSTYGPGEIFANVEGDSDNLWTNSEDVDTGAGGNLANVPFESVTAGPFQALAGTLTELASIQGINTITNPADATPGYVSEPDPAFRRRRVSHVAASGSSTLPAIVAAVAAVPGVISAHGVENTSDVFANGLPPHSFQIIVWDGAPTQADDDAIAQAIQNAKPGGIQSIGALSGTAVKPDGAEVLIGFSRALVNTLYVDVTPTWRATATQDFQLIKDALLAKFPPVVSQDVIWKQLLCAVLDVAGVEDADVRIGFTASPTAEANLPVQDDAIAILQDSNITES